MAEASTKTPMMRRVFGVAATTTSTTQFDEQQQHTNDGDLESATPSSRLSYSLSPSSSLASERRQRAFSTSMSVLSDNNNDDNSDDNGSHSTVSAEQQHQHQVLPSTPESYSSRLTSNTGTSKTSRSLGPFDGILTPNHDEIDKENSSSRNSGRPTIITTMASETPPKRLLMASPDPKAVRQQARQTRLAQRSPLQRDLVQQTQRAIHQAARAVQKQQLQQPIGNAPRLRVNPAVQTGRRREHSRKQQEYQMRAQHQKAAEEQRRKLLNLKVAVMSKASQERAKRHLQERSEILKKADKEAQFQSSVYRDHQHTLKIEADARRRASMQARRKLRDNHRQGAERLKMTQIREDQALSQERQESSRAITNYNRSEAQSRRASFQFRAGDARRIRETHQRLESERQQQEHASFQLQREADKDADDYRRQCAEDRRESLANRGRNKLQQRQRMAELESEAMVREQASLQLKREGDKDAEAYQRQCAIDKRKSFANRGKSMVQQRERANQMASDALAAEQASLQLEQAGHRDARAYQRRMQIERRESLQGRNREHVQHDRVMQELAALAQEKESESLALEMEGHRDAQAYLIQLAAERRESMQLRGKEKVRQRAYEQDQHDESLQQLHADEVMRSKDQQDVQAYRKECAERDRASNEYRHKEAHKSRVEQTEIQVRQQLADAQTAELDRQADADVQAYLTRCRQRRRKSLAWRARDSRRHWAVRHEQEQHRRNDEASLARDRVANALAVEWARQLEATEQAIHDQQYL